MQVGSKLKKLRTNKGGQYYDPSYFQSMGIIQKTTADYAPQPNDVTERTNQILQEMVNPMVSYSSLSE